MESRPRSAAGGPDVEDLESLLLLESLRTILVKGFLLSDMMWFLCRCCCV